jgi:hypothetical protein
MGEGNGENEKVGQNPKRFISFRVDKELVDKVDFRARELGVTRTQWLLRTIQVNLDDNPFARGVPESARTAPRRTDG